jgi:hypothetical protein
MKFLGGTMITRELREVYVTSDGEEFTTSSEAEFHEAVPQLADRIRMIIDWEEGKPWLDIAIQAEKVYKAIHETVGDLPQFKKIRGEHTPLIKKKRKQ